MPKQKQRRRQILDGVVGACLLALLYAGYGLFHRATRTPAGAPVRDHAEAVTVSPAPHPSLPAATSVGPEAPVLSGSSAEIAPVRPAQAKPPHELVPSAKANSSLAAPDPRASGTLPGTDVAPTPVEGVPMYQSSTAQPSRGNTAIGGVASTSAGVGTAITPKAKRSISHMPTVVPERTLNRQLDSPILPSYASDPAFYDSRQRKYPRLLHRGVMPVYSPESMDDAETVAALHTPEIAGVSASAARTGSSSAQRGVVRSACLGMMAGNLDYSPVPAYPTAAAVAKVQGQVRIEATVDRDGSIASARVVSGPPLLREAALDAVQQWRYKPYSAGGKPIPAGTTAVLDFTLP